MSGIELDTRSLRNVRVAARAPKAIALALVAILAFAGLRSALAGPPEAPPAPPAKVQPPPDLAAQAFAQSFTREYLTWKSSEDGTTDSTDERENRLRSYLEGGPLDADAGLTPAAGTTQTVEWTAVSGVKKDGRVTDISVDAGTTAGQFRLAVPVVRNEQGLLAIAGYPAILGRPPVDPAAATHQPVEQDVDDPALTAVVERALTNYLAGEQNNLLADLTPDAVVSLPPQRLTVKGIDDVTWVKEDEVVAARVEATDEAGTSWTLRYALGVQQSDRWYVRSLHIDPTTGR